MSQDDNAVSQPTTGEPETKRAQLRAAVARMNGELARAFSGDDETFLRVGLVHAAQIVALVAS